MILLGSTAWTVFAVVMALRSKSRWWTFMAGLAVGWYLALWRVAFYQVFGL